MKMVVIKVTDFPGLIKNPGDTSFPGAFLDVPFTDSFGCYLLHAVLFTLPGCSIGDNRWQKQPDDHCSLMCITKLKSNPKVIIMAMVYQDLMIF